MDSENIILFQGDALERIRDFPDGSVDLIVTDPPYGIGLSKGYKKGAKNLINGDDGFSVMFFLDDFFTEYKRILKEGGALYVFTRFDVLPYWWIKMKRYFDVKNQIIWAKGGGGMGDLHGSYAPNYEVIIFATKGDHKLRGKREGCVWDIPKCRQEFHETQKPVELIERMILHSSDPGQVVLDPFMGSGTTGVTCLNLDRKFIGIELDPNYCDVAKQRIANHQAQQKLFT
jgi:site-specific DNA-methyltransferase (adenine-specific)